jgi:putative FmdB family regulatory protein
MIDMILHTFRCTKCKNEFKELVRSDSDRIPHCPLCKSSTKKVLGFMFSMGENWPQYNVQAGKTFKNRYEEDSHFEEIGAVKV